MVSTRPQHEPARRMAYPSADAYTPGDTDAAPGHAGDPEESPTQRQQEMLPSEPSAQPASQPQTQTHQGSALQRLRSGGSDMTEREKNTHVLQTWWKNFTQGSSGGIEKYTPPDHRSARGTTMTMNTRGVFGVPLRQVLSYAAMQISTSAPDGSLYVWGEVPIVIGRCGAYLKNKTDIEGMFRVPGSEKRMRELQAIFNQGPKYGVDLDWDIPQDNPRFTAHDVATIFRRYLTMMPEPVIPYAMYSAFLAVMDMHDNKKDQVNLFKGLIRKMPLENQYLLLYILDLLGIFDKQSDKNLMTAANLALVFQPGVIADRNAGLRPSENRPARDVVEFLIENQSYFVFGMSKRISHSRRPSNVKRTASRKSNETYTTARSKLDGGSSLAPTASNPEGGAPSMRSQATSTGRTRSPRPKAVRADTDYMLPSDSDEEAPQGGYYIVERAVSPKSPMSERALSPTSLRTSVQERSALQSLLPPPRASRRKPRHSEPLHHRGQGASVPAIDAMDLSDSDDDTPGSGFYVVYENKPGSAGGGFLTRTRSGADRGSSARPTGEEHYNDPKPSSGAHGLARRKTLPSKRVADLTARMRRPREA